MCILGIRKPGGDIPRLKGAKGKKEKDASKEEKHSRHFIPGASA
jgi:hypothetical protein